MKRTSKHIRMSPDIIREVLKRARKKRLSGRQEADALVKEGMRVEDAKGEA